MKRIILASFLAAACLHAATGMAADIPFTFKDAAEEQRYKELVAELRCLVCQNQSLADSNADLAQDLREEVYRMLQQGADDDEIIGFLTARYGDFVLYRPPMNPVTVLLWFGPLALLLLGAFVMVRFIRRRPANATSALSAQEQKRVAELMENNSKERRS
ncbi:MAG: cytochrome c-type biogenesis protein [Acidiferrobacterales bacterium]